MFGDNDEEQNHHIMEDAKRSGLIRGMDDVESFTLGTNYIEPIQVQIFYGKNILIVQGQYDIQSLVSFIEIVIQNGGFGLTWTKVKYNK